MIHSTTSLFHNALRVTGTSNQLWHTKTALMIETWSIYSTRGSNLNLIERAFSLSLRQINACHHYMLFRCKSSGLTIHPRNTEMKQMLIPLKSSVCVYNTTARGSTSISKLNDPNKSNINRRMSSTIIIRSDSFWTWRFNRENIKLSFAINRITMDIFRMTQNNFQSMGIHRDRIAFGRFELKHILNYVLILISTFMYAIHEAESSKQFMESILMFCEASIAFIAYLSFRFYSQRVFSLMDDYEQTINKSE